MVVHVVMTTFFTDEVPAREEYATESLESLLNNLVCEEGLRLIISDDSEVPHEVCNKMLTMASDAQAPLWHGNCYAHAGHHGIGASLNNALRYVKDDELWMYTTDDWRLECPLNLDGPIKLLNRGYDVVRLGPVHPDLQCVSRFDATIGWWLDLIQHYGGFAFATRPFIATKKFYNKLGQFNEGLNSYETERLYAERVATSTAKLAYWGGINLMGPWQHIGNECVGFMDVDVTNND